MRYQPQACKWILAGMLIFFQPAAVAGVYHYVDDNGRKIFVDRKSQVPPEYREDVRVLESARPRKTSSDVDSPLVESDEPVERQRQHLQAYLKKLETPVEIHNNSVIVPVQATYGSRVLNLNMILDTGASRTMVYSQKIATLRQPKRAAGKVQVADGNVLDTHQVTFSRLQVGPYSMESAPVGVIDHMGMSRHDGLLGMDFLRQVDYEVDFERSLIIWARDEYRKAQDALSKLDQRDENPDEIAE